MENIYPHLLSFLINQDEELGVNGQVEVKIRSSISTSEKLDHDDGSIFDCRQ